MAFVERSLRSTTTSTLRYFPRLVIVSGTRTFFSLPSFPRSTHHEITKLDDLTAPDRYSKRGDLLIYKETKRLPYSKKQAYNVIADIEKYPEFVPYCLGSNLVSFRTLEKNENQTGSGNNEQKPWIYGGNSGETHLLEHELIVGYKTFEERYTSNVECRKWEMVKASASHSSLFKHLSSTWTFRSPDEISLKKNEPEPDSTHESSYVSLQLAFAFASPLHAAIGEFVWKTVSERMVLAFETQLEKVYGKQNTSESIAHQKVKESVVTSVGAQQ